MIWPESVPPELAVQDGRPKLHAVSSGKPPRDRTQPTGADKTPGAREQVDRAAADEKQASVAADHAAPARARADAPAVSSSGGAASGAQREQPPKRELPPYLRVVK
jgi:hypothetical protein